ncbi:type 4 pilus major pilin [Burkholderia vietnamiensis]|uniref:type 4 pilus major pilin n=1 Tax=Burkholderia vietnamiensis TaxID=60552 RepID=UPI00159446F8|nr:type 4 pilus major pilin [Burkholderia vietnamiensis]MCA8270707.1 hypothetical protein [Burkholderia vietnamiensis]
MKIKKGKFVSPSLRNPLKRKQGGWTAIEILVSVAVVSLFIAWVASRGNTLSNQGDATTEAGNVNMLHTQVRAGKTTGGYGPTNSDLAAALINAKKVPNMLTISGTKIMNAWNVAYVITSTGYGFTLTDTVPTDTCASTVQNASQSGDWDLISVNGGTGVSGQISLNSAGTMCNGGSTNVITFTANK